MFGQFIPKDGWHNKNDVGKGYTLRTMKTQELEEQRKEELKLLDDSIQMEKSKAELAQFNQVKKIIMNFAFRDKGKKILSCEINGNVLDEVRRERKINMVLQDKNVDNYINMDITEIDLYNNDSWKDLSLETKLEITEKLLFRENLAQKVSITRLDYMLKVLKIVLGKGTLTDPDAFRDKLRQMVRADRAAQGLKRIRSGSSFRSLFSKS